MKKSILFFAALAALFSCSKENPVDNYNPIDDTYSVTLTATAPGADTKTTLVDGENAEGKPVKFVHWSKGDAIKVLFFPGRHGNAITGPSGVFQSHFDVETSESANFRIEKWSFGMDQTYLSDRLKSKGVAVYPSSANASSTKESGSYTSNVTDISFTLPLEQNAIEGNIESNLNFSYADVDLESFTNTINNPAHQTKLTFNNTCALIQLTMPAELPKVTEISITSNDKVALTGHGCMNLSYYKDEIAGGVNVTDGNKNVVLNCVEGFKAGATYYAVVWPGEHTSGLTIEFTAEDGSIATKTTGAVTLTSSKVKPYTFNKGLDFVVPVQEFDYIYADGTTGNEVKSNIVGVVIFRGNPKEKFNDLELPDTYCNGLAISTNDVVSTTWGGATSLSNVPSSVKVSSASTALANGGYTVKANWNNNGFNSLPMYTNSSTVDISKYNTSGWYLPVHNEWNYIFSNLSEINAQLTAAGCDIITLTSNKNSGSYWIPVATGSNAILVYTNYYGTALAYATDWQYSAVHNARPIFAF